MMMTSPNQSPTDLPKGPNSTNDLFLRELSPSATLLTTSSVGVPTPSSWATTRRMPPPTILPQTFHSDRRRWDILLHKPAAVVVVVVSL